MSNDRGLTAAMESEVGETVLRPAVFVELEFSSGTTRLWSGYGELTWDSKTWTGATDLGQISEITETLDLKAVGMTLTLNGIPSELISVALQDEYRNKPCRIWLGMFNDNMALLADPIRIFTGRMDTMTIQENGQTSSIHLAVENRLIDLERPRVLRWTDQEQKQINTTESSLDRALEYVPTLQEKEIVWGR